MNKNKRKICFVITSFIHYSRNFLILKELNNIYSVDLHIVVGGAALVSKYTSKEANLLEILKSDGIKNIHEIHFNLEGDGHIVKAKTTGLGILEFSTVFNLIKPDIVVVRGDRFEVLAATVAATYLGISLAHIEGGDLSGTLDESVRHAITKFAHIHFVTNEDAKQRVLRMGENKDYVFNFGSPDVEVIKKNNALAYYPDNYINKGSGANIDFSGPFIMVMYHPVASEIDSISKYTRLLLESIHKLNMQTIWFWPNFDVGSEEISTQLRFFNDMTKDHKIRFMRYLAPNDFLALLSKTKCFIGNSSAGIKECSYLGIPVVNIGSRQNNRLRTKNIKDVGYVEEDIIHSIKEQIAHGQYESDLTYNMDNTAYNIANTLATIDLYTQKSFQ
jgi:UDP-hydrolysing UDP-N-acetyl-D-glucosamine 2-epimerase